MARELRQLERVFNIFDPGSDLRRFRAGAAPASTPLRDLLRIAEQWKGRTGGAFDPFIDDAREAWEDASRTGNDPPAEVLHEASAGSATALNLNAIAKGWIIDRALDVARNVTRPPAAAWIDAGGDIVHFGAEPIAVGIEDPLRPYDNAAPVAVVELRDAAIATSGAAHRSFTVGGTAHSHVLDPRTATPADRQASATVIAPDAVTADVLATALTVLHPIRGLELIATVAGASALIIDRAGEQFRSSTWPG